MILIYKGMCSKIIQRAFVFTLALVAIVCVRSSSAQEEIREQHFRYELISLKSPDTVDSVRTDIYVAVPYSFLFFQNAVDRYIADYTVTIEIKDPVSESVVYSKKQENSVSLPTTVWDKLKELDQTRADASQYSVRLLGGHNYHIQIRITDLTKKNELVSDTVWRTRSFVSPVLSISDLLLYRTKIGNRLTPNIGDDISEISAQEGGAFFEVYNAPQSVPFWVVHSIVDDGGSEISRLTKIVVSDGRTTMRLFSRFSNDDLWTGSYLLHSFVTTNVSDTGLELKKLISSSQNYSEHRLTVGIGHGVPLVNGDLDESIQQLYVISVGGAYDSLVFAQTANEKRTALKDFWDKMNVYRGTTTTRPMEVFYQRVRYANEHFDHLGPGWRSDRGKVYLMLGAPTSIDRNAYSAGQRPYETWMYYDLNQRYYFVDQFLINDYRLMGPLPPPGTFRWERDGQ